MDITISRIQMTVYFDNPYWVAVLESVENDSIRICRIVYGQEPKDYQVQAFLSRNFRSLKFSSPIEIGSGYIKQTPVNPKRVQREINKLKAQKGISTKAQMALSKEREQNKKEKKKKSKETKDIEKKLQFEMKQNKKKQKRKGH